jgi:hypothetical protein
MATLRWQGKVWRGKPYGIGSVISLSLLEYDQDLLEPDPDHWAIVGELWAMEIYAPKVLSLDERRN